MTKAQFLKSPQGEFTKYLFYVGRPVRPILFGYFFVYLLRDVYLSLSESSTEAL